VDNIRQIKDEVLFAPHTGRYKIYIIDEVHMLSMSAFNALLKTIEEPPPYIVFIFATTEPQKVPATIKSRCQQFNFRLVPTDIIFQLLTQTAAESGIEAEEEALLWIAREAAGSVRDAYTLFDQIAAFSGTKITTQNIRDTLGLVGIDRLNELFRAIVSNNAKEAFGVLDDILERGVSPEQFLIDAVDYCRSILLMLHGVQKQGLLSAPRTAFEPFVVESLSKDQIEYTIALLLDTYRHLKETIEPRYELELTVAKLCNIRSYISPRELFEAVHSLKSPQRQRTFAWWGGTKDVSLPFQSRPADSTTTDYAPLLHDVHPRAKNSPQYTEQTQLADGSSEPAATKVDSASAGLDTASDRHVSPSELRKKIIAKLRNQNLFLASALEKSAEWISNHQGFIIPATNRVELDLITRFAPLIAEISAQILGTPCAIEARLAKDQESSAFRPSHDERTQPAHPSRESLHESPAPNDSNGERRKTPDQSAGQTFDHEPLRTDSFEMSALAEEIENTGECNNSGDDEPSRHAASSAPQELIETDVHAIELIRKMFKGKVIATYPPAETSPSPSSAPQQQPSSSVADASEYLEDIEPTEEPEDGDEDDF